MSFQERVIKTRNDVLKSAEYQVAINDLRNRAEAYKAQTNEKQIADLEK